MRLHGTRGVRPRRAITQKKGEDLEAIFSIQIRAIKLPEAQREYQFHPKRKWKFDFAWPHCKIAVEIEGGTYTNGRHVRPEGFRRDCEKYNAAALLGWQVYRGDVKMVKNNILLDTVQAALNQEKGYGTDDNRADS